MKNKSIIRNQTRILKSLKTSCAVLLLLAGCTAPAAMEAAVGKGNNTKTLKVRQLPLNAEGKPK